MLRFQTESVDDFARDGAAIFPLHFEELSLNKDKIPYRLDLDWYRKIEEQKLLYILTARLDGKLVGYHLSMVMKHHIHNADAGAYATTDMFYVLPEHRNGIGVKLILEWKQRMIDMGVKRIAISTKLKDNHLELFQKLGFQATDLMFHQVLI